MTVICKLISMFLGGEVMMVGAFMTTFTCSSKKKTLYYLLMILVNIYFTIVMKLILHAPRPYMVVDEEIKVNGFSSEFGDPSGHTMSSAQVLLTMYLDIAKEKGWKKWWMFIPPYISVVGIVGYSRMFNGVHSLDQVIYGCLIGVWIAGTGHYCVRDQLYNHIDIIKD